LLFDQLFTVRIADTRIGFGRVDLNNEFRIQLEAHLTGNFLDRVPAVIRVGTFGVTSENSYFLMSQFAKMSERELGSMPMIQNNIRNALVFSMARYGDGRHRQRVSEIVVDGDDSFCSPLLQKPAITLEKLGVMPVYAGDEKIIFFARSALDSGNHAGTISVA